MLNAITQPALIAHGNKVVVVDPINAFILAERLPNATLLGRSSPCFVAVWGVELGFRGSWGAGTDYV
jgi:hypothetical protein